MIAANIDCLLYPPHSPQKTQLKNLPDLNMTSGTVIKAKDLENSGIPCTTSDRIYINNVLLRRGQSFSLRFRQAAIDLANDYVTQDLSCVVVESPFHLTLWYTDR